MVVADCLDDTPIGTVWAAASDAGLVAVSLWDDAARFAREVAELTGEEPALDGRAHPVLASALAELDLYLQGQWREFKVPIDWSPMTIFQRQALELVCRVPYGHTSSYQAIADQLGRPGASRAVGRANATNPIPIVIPCHRILGSDGKLHGYGARGGVETKAWLLRLEGSWLL